MILNALIAFLFISFSTPNDYKDFINEGDILYNNAEMINALKEYEKAYKLAPAEYDVLFRLVRTYNDVGEEQKELRKRDEAEKYFNKGLEIAQKFHKIYPDSAAVYTYLALSYGNVAMFKGGKDKVTYAKLIEENAKKSIKLSQSDFMPYIILGIYFRELASLSWIERAFANAFFGGIPSGSLEDSEKMLKKSLQIYPDLIISLYQLSKTYRAMERHDEEKKLLNKILTLKNQNFRDRFTKEKAKRRLSEM